MLDGDGNPVIGFGTAPIDIPNCERCHSNRPGTVIATPRRRRRHLTVVNSRTMIRPSGPLVQQEYNFWNGYYGIDTGAGDSDWYSRLKSAAISMLHGHDVAARHQLHGQLSGSRHDRLWTSGELPQNTRLGHESIICQKCHADNVIAVVKSATHDGGDVIPPVTEAIHNNHRGVSEGG